MAVVRWSDISKLDLREIAQFWFKVTGDKQFTARLVNLIRSDLKQIAGTPMLDRDDPEFRDSTQHWSYAKGTEYKVFYWRIGPRTIKIARLWPSRRQPLESSKIFEEN